MLSSHWYNSATRSFADSNDTRAISLTLFAGLESMSETLWESFYLLLILMIIDALQNELQRYYDLVAKLG